MFYALVLAIGSVAAQGTSKCEGAGWPLFSSSIPSGNIECIGRGTSIPACRALGRTGAKYVLTVQNDGNLVVYNAATNAAAWSSGSFSLTQVDSDTALRYLPSGEVALVAGSRGLVWSLRTAGGTNGWLCVDTERGNVVLYENQKLVWDSEGGYKDGSGYPLNPATTTQQRQTQANTVLPTASPLQSDPSPQNSPKPSLPPTTQTPELPPPTSSFSAGAIAAVVVASFVLLGFGAFLLYRRKKFTEVSRRDILQPVTVPFITVPAPAPKHIGPPPNNIEMTETPTSYTTGRPIPTAFFMAKDNYPITGESKHDGELTLIAGARVEVIDTRDEWYRGRTEPGAFYWVHKSRLEPVG
ncbi:hypothetical protein BDR26DRAFT_857221 [Obelidium mucronatum]|nr:hypothetical protein BDR26DRAFT_857221 [Obelidium mucronatum]